MSLSNEDIGVLLQLYEVKQDFNKLRSIPAINYELALKAVVPRLRRNNDKMFESDPSKNFKIGWTISNNARTRAEYMRKIAEDQ